MAQTKALTLRQRATALGTECGGYSADRYRSWPAVAYALLKEGFTEREAEAIMRSKWTRWAADHDDAHRYGQHPGYIVADYLWGTDLRILTPEALAKEVLELVAGTFTDEKGHVSPEDYQSLVERLTQAHQRRAK